MQPKTKEDLKASLPDTFSSPRLKGLDATIDIFRDDYGIPHVKAQSAHDAFFGQGSPLPKIAFGRWSTIGG